MITSADAKVLKRLVGSATFARGSDYARTGAVRKRTWSPGGTHVVGEIQGGTRQPYVATVTLTRSQSKGLSAFQATCTCPVGVNCKHAVALVLAEESSVHSGQVPLLTLVRNDTARIPPTLRQEPIQSTGRESDPSDWKLPLETLLESDGNEAVEPGDIDIGLQFELVLDPGGAGIRVRPVTPGRNGSWVRTGISWSNLDYYRYWGGSAPEATERLALVKELLALSRLANRRPMHSYSDDVVRLETINSRRLWDLIGEARALGLPLVQSGRRSQPITFVPRAADVTIDVTRSEAGLRVEPRIGIEGQGIPLQQLHADRYVQRMASRGGTIRQT